MFHLLCCCRHFLLPKCLIEALFRQLKAGGAILRAVQAGFFLLFFPSSPSLDLLFYLAVCAAASVRSFIFRTQLPQRQPCKGRCKAALSELNCLPTACLHAECLLFCVFAFISPCNFVCLFLLQCLCSVSPLPSSALTLTHLPSSCLQSRTPRVTRLSPTQPALADQASRVSFASAENLETMSESDLPIGFNRMNRLRQSLPLARSSSQAKLRAPGQRSSHNSVGFIISVQNLLG